MGNMRRNDNVMQLAHWCQNGMSYTKIWNWLNLKMKLGQPKVYWGHWRCMWKKFFWKASGQLRWISESLFEQKRVLNLRMLCTSPCYCVMCKQWKSVWINFLYVGKRIKSFELDWGTIALKNCEKNYIHSSVTG